MPVLLDESSEPSNDTPESERDDQPNNSIAVVGQEASKDTSERVEIVEDWTGYYLVEKTTTIMSPLTCLVDRAIVFKGYAKTGSFVVPVRGERMHERREREREREKERASLKCVLHD